MVRTVGFGLPMIQYYSTISMCSVTVTVTCVSVGKHFYIVEKYKYLTTNKVLKVWETCHQPRTVLYLPKRVEAGLKGPVEWHQPAPFERLSLAFTTTSSIMMMPSVDVSSTTLATS